MTAQKGSLFSGNNEEVEGGPPLRTGEVDRRARGPPQGCARMGLGGWVGGGIFGARGDCGVTARSHAAVAG